MAEEITTSAANQGGAIGHIVRIVGPVVDSRSSFTFLVIWYAQ